MKSVALPAFAAGAALVALASHPAAAEVASTPSAVLYSNLYTPDPDQASPSATLLQGYMPTASAAGTGSMSQDLGEDAAAPLTIQGPAVAASHVMTRDVVTKAADKPIVDTSTLPSLPSPTDTGSPDFGSTLQSYLDAGLQAFQNSEQEQNGGSSGSSETGNSTNSSTGGNATPASLPEPASVGTVLTLAVGGLLRRRKGA